MKVFVKGIVTREDAELAMQHGVDGLFVSNHGGRAENSGRATILRSRSRRRGPRARPSLLMAGSGADRHLRALAPRHRDRHRPAAHLGLGSVRSGRRRNRAADSASRTRARDASAARLTSRNHATARDGERRESCAHGSSRRTTTGGGAWFHTLPTSGLSCPMVMVVVEDGPHEIVEHVPSQPQPHRRASVFRSTCRRAPVAESSPGTDRAPRFDQQYGCAPWLEPLRLIEPVGVEDIPAKSQRPP